MKSPDDTPPTVAEKLLWQVEDGKLDPCLLLDLTDFYWPKFISRDGYIFLEMNFKENRYKQLYQSKNIEYWMNMFSLDCYFNDVENSSKLPIRLGNTLSQIWRTKLERDFPDITFAVQCLEDSDNCDCVITFYQTKFSV